MPSQTVTINEAMFSGFHVFENLKQITNFKDAMAEMFQYDRAYTVFERDYLLRAFDCFIKTPEPLSKNEEGSVTPFHVFYVMSKRAFDVFAQTGTLQHRQDICHGTNDVWAAIHLHSTPLTAFWMNSYVQNTKQIKDTLDPLYVMLSFRVEKSHLQAMMASSSMSVASRVEDNFLLLLNEVYRFTELEIKTLSVLNFGLDYDLFKGENFRFEDGYLRAWGRIFDVAFQVPTAFLDDVMPLLTYQTRFHFKTSLDNRYTKPQVELFKQRQKEFEKLYQSHRTVHRPIETQAFRIGQDSVPFSALAETNIRSKRAHSSATAALEKGQALHSIMKAEQDK